MGPVVRGGFGVLVNPGTRISDVDLEATRADRERLHAEVRARLHIAWLLSVSTPGGDLVRVTPYEVRELDELPEAGPASVAELFDLAVNGTGVPA